MKFFLDSYFMKPIYRFFRIDFNKISQERFFFRTDCGYILVCSGFLKIDFKFSQSSKIDF